MECYPSGSACLPFVCGGGPVDNVFLSAPCPTPTARPHILVEFIGRDRKSQHQDGYLMVTSHALFLTRRCAICMVILISKPPRRIQQRAVDAFYTDSGTLLRAFGGVNNESRARLE